MTLRARVGRHTHQGGRHCQNWIEDQQAVVALLNRIPPAEGGAGGGLNGNIAGRMVAGMSSDALYRAISAFEDKHFPGQRSGFVDPGGRMLKRMEELAARATGVPTADPDAPPPEPPAENPLDILRRNVLDETSSRGYTAGERVAFDPLVTLVVRHIDSLKDQGFDKLPWRVEMFGRAHVTKMEMAVMLPSAPDTVQFVSLSKDKLNAPPRKLPLPEMRYGAPVDIYSDVTTEKLGAFLLYNDGWCHRVYPYRHGSIWSLGRPRGTTRSILPGAR